MAKKKKIPRIAFIGETEYVFNQNLLLGLAKYAQINGPWGVYIVKEGPDLEQRLDDLQVDALVVRDARENMKLLERGLPSVLIAGYFPPNPEQPTIESNCEAVGEMGAEYFLERGYQNYAYCGYYYPKDAYWSNLICDRYTQVLKTHGFAVHSFCSSDGEGELSWEAELPFLTEWLKSLPKPVAMLVCNDVKAPYVIQACKELGIAVPEEVAVVGVNNEPMQCAICTPPLSSIVMNVQKAGFDAGAVLDDMLHGKEPHTTYIRIEPTHVLTRQSSDINAIENADVARALQFIRENAKFAIQVNDVVEVTTVSRRVLEKEFRKHLGCTILNKIRQVRTSLVSRALIETDMSIKEIAAKFGFNDTHNLAHYYRNATGLSMSEYRDKHKI